MSAVARAQVRVALAGLALGLAVLGLAWLRAPADLGVDGGAVVWPGRGLGVVAFGVDGALGAWTVRKDEERWRVDSPPGAPADPARIRRILHALDEGRSGPSVGEAAPGMGFDAPTTLWVEDERGRRVTRVVGAAAAVSDRTYLQLPEGEVVAVRGGLWGLLDGGPPVDLRLVSEADAVGVDLRGEAHALQRDEDGWRWASGGLGEAESWGWALHEARIGEPAPAPAEVLLVTEAEGARCHVGRVAESAQWAARCEDGREGALDAPALIALLQALS